MVSADRVCIVEGCERPYSTRRLCRAHYYRMWKYGNLDWPNCKQDGCGQPAAKNQAGASRGWCVRHAAAEDGTTRITAEGYVSIKHGGVWCLEHRLAMEDRLGRKLLSAESVHHVNGVRSDNRPENLELWFSAHPYGQRIPDLIDYLVAEHRAAVVERLSAANETTTHF